MLYSIYYASCHYFICDRCTSVKVQTVPFSNNLTHLFAKKLPSILEIWKYFVKKTVHGLWMLADAKRKVKYLQTSTSHYGIICHVPHYCLLFSHINIIMQVMHIKGTT